MQSMPCLPITRQLDSELLCTGGGILETDSSAPSRVEAVKLACNLVLFGNGMRVLTAVTCHGITTISELALVHRMNGDKRHGPVLDCGCSGTACETCMGHRPVLLYPGEVIADHGHRL